nr:MAG TPA: hypothetical protein [Caudoviricetes sp.]
MRISVIIIHKNNVCTNYSDEIMSLMFINNKSNTHKLFTCSSILQYFFYIA